MTTNMLDYDGTWEQRRATVAKTIQIISTEDLKKLGEKLFPVIDHPWRETYFNFLSENTGSPFYHASAGDRVEVIYCPAKEKGIWYMPGSGLGPLQPRGLNMLKEILGKK